MDLKYSESELLKRKGESLISFIKRAPGTDMIKT